MGARHADRLWIVAGAVGTVILVAATWFLLISPTRGRTDDLGRQAADARVALIRQRRDIAALAQKAAQLPRYQATLRSLQAALPADSGVPNFLRYLQESDDAVDVTVTGLSVSAPIQEKGTPVVYALPITVTADGSPVNLGRFLDQLQHAQPRAVLVQSANLAGKGTTGGASGDMSMTVAMKAFVAPAGGLAPTIAVSR
jgi:Tfp pilus assembly protein PilO